LGISVDFLRVAKEIAYSHQEKWDGSGYPNGLKGEQIPLWGRLSAVADVFDALTTKRPYKPAFPNDKALQIIREGRGSHFDPKVVDCFFSVLDEIEKIQKHYADQNTLVQPAAAPIQGAA
jgi:putative two-component system response regulator